MADTEQTPVAVYDLAGIGFGPSNLALAIALQEESPARSSGRLSDIFLERKADFDWHPGMLIEDATMQVSFLKDLVTIRNPNSDYSFLSYLKERDRLVDFINHKTFFPTRIEFHDYFHWAARRLSGAVRYDREVIAMLPVHDGDRIVAVDLLTESACSGEQRAPIRTRNVVMGTGLRPSLPIGISSSSRIWHSSEFLTRLAETEFPPHPHIVVVGAGQSAAEIVQHLHRRIGDATVHAVFSRYGYSPADNSPFANSVFDPDAVDDYFNSPQQLRDDVTAYHANTNYSVVDAEVITDLYHTVYTEKVQGPRRLLMHNLSRVAAQEEFGDVVAVTLEHLGTGEVQQLAANVLIYATGYSPVDPSSLLGELSSLMSRDGLGRLEVDRDYRVRTSDSLECGFYLQGGTEHTHGLSSSLLSNLPVRAADIVSSVRSRQPAVAV